MVKRKKLLYQIVAALLCIAMVLPYIPAVVWAVDSPSAQSEETVYVLAGSDFQATANSYQEANATAAQRMTAILSRVKSAYSKFDALMFCGDYSSVWAPGVGVDYGSTSGWGKLNEVLASNGLNDVDRYFVQGNHDPADYASLTATGGYNKEHYATYVLNWEAYGASNNVQNQANALKAWLDSQTVGQKPIFVLSHQPLHYSMRLYNEGGDAQYAKYLVDVLNAAGQRGLNIIFLYGHNHSSVDDYMGGSTNFIGKGETIWIANPEGYAKEPSSRVLNFTYMNAGYVSSTTTTGPDRSSTMSVFEITGDDVVIRRYDANGEHALQAAAGVMSSSDIANGYSTDRNPCPSGKKVYGGDLDVTVSSIVSTGDFHVGGFATAKVNNPAAGNVYNWTTDDSSVISITQNADGSANIYGKGEGTALVRVVEIPVGRGSGARATEFYVHVFGGIVLETNGVIYQLATQLFPGNRYVFADRNTVGTATLLRYTSSTAQGNLGNTQNGIISYNKNAPYLVLNGTAENQNKMTWIVGASDQEGYVKLHNAYYGPDYALQIDGSASGRYINQLLLGNGTGMLSAESNLWGYDQNTGLFSFVRAYKVDGSGNVDLSYPKENYIFNFGTKGDYSNQWWLVNSYWRDGNYFNRVYAYEERMLTAIGSLSDAEGQVAVGAASSAETGSMIVKTWLNGQVEYIPVTVDMLRTQDGATISTAKAGVYTNLNVLWTDGRIISAGYTLIVGEPVTVPVAGGYYYRLTDQLKQGADFNSEYRYLILNRNVRGEGKLMEATDNTGTGMTSTSIFVTLDADGVPSVRSEFLKEEDYGSSGKAPGKQEWWYHKHSDGIWYLWQPSWAFNNTSNNYMRIAGFNAATVVSGSRDDYAFRNPEYKLSGDGMYSTIQGTFHGETYYLEFFNSNGCFMGVSASNRNRGQEVYIYEKVTYNTAAVTAMSTHGHVSQGATGAAATDTKLMITYPDGTKEYVDVTLNMLTGSGLNLNKPGEYGGLKLTYNGVTITNDFELHVMPTTGVDNPDAPNGGHVEVSKDKDTTEFNFDETGVARVDLSTNGIPMDAKLDVLVMVDTSSSINNFMDNGETRIEAMRDALNELVENLRRPNSNGSMPDVMLSVWEFNDYTYFGDTNTLLGTDNYGSSHGISDNHTSIARNGEVLDYTSIYNVGQFTAEQLYGHMGTNYDVAMQMAYEAVRDRKADNKAAGVEREQVVIFMTDGICYQYNYLSYSETANQSDAWAKWLTGGMTDADLANYVPAAARDWYNPEGKHWMAEAIKGTEGVKYPVIWNDDKIYTGAAYNASTNMKQVDGLGATLFTIGFGIDIDGAVSARVGEKILSNMASDPSKYYNADNANELRDVFRDAVISVQKAATNAQFVDKLGADFDLQTGRVVNSKGEVVALKPTITIKVYDLFEASEVGTVVNGVFVNEQMVGERKSNTPSKIIETITFSDDGMQAYSDLIYTTDLGGQKSYPNILVNGVIDAFYFDYNTATETFTWTIGEIPQQELVLSYYVYLEGSMGEVKNESGAAAGTYETNTFADLSYINYQNKNITLKTESPTLDWKDTSVNYGYYVVDSNGNPVNSNGQKVDFNNKQTVGDVTGADDLLLNIDNKVIPGKVPTGYYLYEVNPSGTVNSNSGNNCGGEVESSDNTTYITVGDNGYNTDVTSKTGNFNEATVWFAVVKIQILPDAVVIDFGLPVDITVLPNDIIDGENFELVAVGPYSSTLDNGSTASLPANFSTSGNVKGTYGNYKVNGEKVRFDLQTLKMNGYEKFLYAVKHNEPDGGVRYYYAAVSVIPATTIYYEDAFTSIGFTKTTYTSMNPDGSVNGANTTNGWTAVSGGTVQTEQDEDRVGDGMKLNDLLKAVKADRYGYDSHYVKMSTYSNGGAHMVTVNENTYATVTFTFTGTGFDIISLTSDKTGLIAVKVTDQNNQQVFFNIVDTFYGYKFENGQWIVDDSDNDALYQVPVMKADLKNFGTYTVTVTATYNSFFDHNSKDGNQYDFYLDAIRIYNPAGDGVKGTDTTIRDAYIADGELDPTYEELRNEVIDKNTFDSLNSDQVNGVVFIDGIKDVGNSGDPNASKPNNKPNMTYQIATYMNFGPNNELYLAPGQAIAFKLESVAQLQSIQLAFKSQGDFSTDGSPNQDGVKDGAGTAGLRIYRNGTKYMEMYVKTATDMYYDLTDLVGQHVIIYNFHTDGILSITNIKTTYTDGSTAEARAAKVLKVSARTGALALETLNTEVNEQLPENPDVNIPEGGESEGNGNTGSNPGTGDLELNMVVMVMLISLCMLAAVVLMGRRMKEARE